MRKICQSIPAAMAIGTLAVSTSAQISDLTQWSLLEDPAHPLFDASVSSTTATLMAGDGAIPSATDIGFASVNGADVADSTSGFYFDPGSDFHVAIDYDLSFGGSTAALGGLAVGLGIGEDVAGADSAGISALIQSGPGTGLLATAARDDDVLAGGSLLSFTPLPTGTLFIAYTASSGDVTGGHSPAQGAAMAASSSAITGVQNLWEDDGLLVSFFLRSQGLNPTFPGWTAGEATAVFSNFRVLEGQAIAVPEPGSLVLLGVAGAGLLLRRRS